MENQYFQDDAKLIDDPHILTYFGKDKELTFKTNSGLFAKEKLDFFSIVLSETINKQNVESYLDLGCGYGFIGISLATKYPNAKKYFIDITQRAIDYTKENIAINNISDTTVIKSDGIQIEDKFDLIALNPPVHAGKETMYKLYKQAAEHLTDNGSFYVVLHKKHGALSTIKDMQSVFSIIETVYKKKGLYVLEMKK
ncbi:class I SAM-dependent methyltransferase [Mycoplasma sp. P36-A1]|uniref:class I SAM-dependent methyltransferase n=1 Tax=Mycoplasma sp. P36-A1 TaxID=3252900 RepID=UPI003C2FC481